MNVVWMESLLTRPGDELDSTLLYSMWYNHLQTKMISQIHRGPHQIIPMGG